jgi:spermidine/putrescine transport system permease protein
MSVCELGFWTIVIAHIMFCISFVVVTVKARLQSLDPRLEEAPRTCTPTPGSTFWKVTFPLVLPGIVGAALLSFSLSFDDFIITNFVSGNETTFPKFVYVSYLRGIPAQANVIGFSMFVIALAARHRRADQDHRVPPARVAGRKAGRSTRADPHDRCRRRR